MPRPGHPLSPPAFPARDPRSALPARELSEKGIELPVHTTPLNLRFTQPERRPVHGPRKLRSTWWARCRGCVNRKFNGLLGQCSHESRAGGRGERWGSAARLPRSAQRGPAGWHGSVVGLSLGVRAGGPALRGILPSNPPRAMRKPTSSWCMRGSRRSGETRRERTDCARRPGRGAVRALGTHPGGGHVVCGSSTKIAICRSVFF